MLMELLSLTYIIIHLRFFRMIIGTFVIIIFNPVAIKI